VNDLDERKKFKTTLATITHYFQQIDDVKEGIKETITDLSGTSGIDKKTIMKLAKTMYKHNYASLQEENRHFETLYEMLVEGKLSVVQDPLDKEAA
jgi:DNA-binding IclR family transcriptional regulator